METKASDLGKRENDSHGGGRYLSLGSSDRTEILERMGVDSADAMAEEAETDPDLVTGVPHSTFHSRLDETAAAPKPVPRWQPASEPAHTAG